MGIVIERNRNILSAYWVSMINTQPEKVVNKTRFFEKWKSETEKCLTQCEKLCNEKLEFEVTEKKNCSFFYFEKGLSYFNCSAENKDKAMSFDIIEIKVKLGKERWLTKSYGLEN